ncbi:MAG: transglutaminase-like domain-containing protein [Verrucomicrobiota bacterium]
MTKNRQPVPGPPRLLLGISLLFWGGMIGHPLIGLLLALATEASHWTRIRWDFGDQAYYRAWHGSVLLVFFAGVLVWMNSSNFTAFPTTISWLPALFFPLQFVQAYGMRRTMPLATFSLFVRKRREHARRHGLPFRDIQIAFGNVYFVIIMVSSALGTHAKTPVFFPCVTLLVFWLFHRQLLLRRGVAPAAALLMLCLAAAFGFVGDRIMENLYQRLLPGYGGSQLSFARQNRTSIGELGEIKQSPNIVWRIQPVSGSFPRLIRVASYNTYLNTYWRAELPLDSDGKRVVNDFVELDFIGIEDPFRVTARKDAETFLSGDDAAAERLPRFTLRGALAQKDLLPIPADAGSVVIPAQNLEINSLGTVRIDPKHPIANATILWDPKFDTGKPPWEVRGQKDGVMESPDLEIPDHEREAIQRVARELRLHEGSLIDKINRLRNHYLQHFTYTRYQHRPKPGTEQGRDQFISLFLEHSKRGHCEYFATASAMLLREAGVPTRYATGFAVVEFDRSSGEALLRGTHAHAWCEAWDAERETWIDVDLTPPDWTGLETPRMPPWQDLLDRWHMLRDDLLVWRSQPGNLAIALTIIFIPFLLGALLVAKRLWKSKRHLGPAAAKRIRQAEENVTPLSALEKPASRILGPKPPGMPLGPWLLQLLPELSESDPLREAVTLHRALRFDPDADAEGLTERLGQLADRLKQELKKGS